MTLTRTVWMAVGVVIALVMLSANQAISPGPVEFPTVAVLVVGAWICWGFTKGSSAMWKAYHQQASDALATTEGEVETLQNGFDTFFGPDYHLEHMQKVLTEAAARCRAKEELADEIREHPDSSVDAVLSADEDCDNEISLYRQLWKTAEAMLSHTSYSIEDLGEQDYKLRT